MYAIVDIETTGGTAFENRIIEIGIIKHNGQETVEKFHTLINPRVGIPSFIRALTGISDEMLINAPFFEDVAARIDEITKDCVFVAHNVNFDYSFLRKEFARLNLDFQRKRACTIRLSRSLFPGLPSYSLGRLCTSLNIPIYNKHRAMGDAQATSILFKRLLDADKKGVISDAVKKLSRELTLPPYLNRKDFDKLPKKPGVYYFKNNKGQILYIGKALNLKQRVASHFSLGSESRRKNFLNEIHSITHEECGNELVAYLLESEEIKKYWPPYNVSQRKATVRYGVFEYKDQRNYARFGVTKLRKSQKPVISFSSIMEARFYILRKVREFHLCPKLAGIQEASHECYDYSIQNCNGACIGQEDQYVYNERHTRALISLKEDNESYLVTGQGRHGGEYSAILVENGVYKGFGFVHKSVPHESIDIIRAYIKPSPENEYSHSIIQNYIQNHPETEVLFFNSYSCEIPKEEDSLPQIGLFQAFE